eukprot:gene10502-19217_t
MTGVMELADLTHRCSELTKLKRGHAGPQGLKGEQGRDGLSGQAGRDGAPGRDGRDCPCQGLSASQLLEEKYGSSFSPRNKRTAVVTVPVKNATFIRFGKATCPIAVGIMSLTGGRTTIDYSKMNPHYECSSLHKGPVKQQVPGFQFFPGLQFLTPMYSVKYRVRHHSPFKNKDELHGKEVPCISCLATKVEASLMLQGTSQCPEDWTLAYRGYVMSENWNHLRSENICVDMEAEKLNAPSFDGRLATLTALEASCHGKACGTDLDEKAIKCVVCLLKRDTKIPTS